MQGDFDISALKLSKGNARAEAESDIATRSRRPWRPEEDRLLRIGMANGRAATTIAAQLKRTTRSVRRRAEVLKLSWRGNSVTEAGPKPDSGVSADMTTALVANPRWTPEEDDRLRRLVEEGRSALVISERLKRSQPAIYTRAKKLGVNLHWKAKRGRPALGNSGT